MKSRVSAIVVILFLAGLSLGPVLMSPSYGGAGQHRSISADEPPGHPHPVAVADLPDDDACTPDLADPESSAIGLQTRPAVPVPLFAASPVSSTALRL